MPFISRSRLSELEAAERRLDVIEEDDRKANRDNTKQIKALERTNAAKIADLTEKHEEEILKLGREHRAEIRVLDQKVEDADERAAKAQKEADKKADARVEKAEADLKAANAKTEKELASRESKVETAELTLKAREERVKAREDAVAEANKEFDSKVAKHAKEVNDARDEGYKHGERKGYANGIADGVRTIGEQTKEANEKVANMGNKAQDALIEAVKRDIPQPTVNVLSVPTVAPAASNSQKQK